MLLQEWQLVASLQTDVSRLCEYGMLGLQQIGCSSWDPRHDWYVQGCWQSSRMQHLRFEPLLLAGGEEGLQVAEMGVMQSIC